MSTRRGAILLEVIVSVAIFVASAITLIGVLSQSDSIAARAREEQIASDLCRTVEPPFVPVGTDGTRFTRCHHPDLIAEMKEDLPVVPISVHNSTPTDKHLI